MKTECVASEWERPAWKTWPQCAHSSCWGNFDWQVLLCNPAYEQSARWDENEINLWVSTSDYKVFLDSSVTQGHLLMDTFNPVDQKQIFWRLHITHFFLQKSCAPNRRNKTELVIILLVISWGKHNSCYRLLSGVYHVPHFTTYNLTTGILLSTIVSDDGNVHPGQELFFICDYISLCLRMSQLWCDLWPQGIIQFLQGWPWLQHPNFLLISAACLKVTFVHLVEAL